MVACTVLTRISRSWLMVYSQACGEKGRIGQHHDRRNANRACWNLCGGIGGRGHIAGSVVDGAAQYTPVPVLQMDRLSRVHRRIMRREGHSAWTSMHRYRVAASVLVLGIAVGLANVCTRD